jgi:hypothetical protein
VLFKLLALKHQKRPYLIKLLIFSVAFVIYTGAILKSPVWGLPDNGDFWRLTNPVELRAIKGVAAPKGRYVWSQYRKSKADNLKYWSSAKVFAYLAKKLNFFSLSKNAVFDIRQMGLFYLITSFGLLLFLAKRNLLLSLVILFLGFDHFTLLNFNSFYLNPSFYLYFIFLLTLGKKLFSSWLNGSFFSYFVFVIVASFFSQVASVYIHNVFLFLLLFSVFCICSKQKLRYPVIAALILSLSVGPYLYNELYSKKNQLEALVKYDLIFMGLGEISTKDEFVADLIELGIPKGLAPYQGHMLFSNDFLLHEFRNSSMYGKRHYSIKKSSRFKIIKLMVEKKFISKLLKKSFDEMLNFNRTWLSVTHSLPSNPSKFWKPNIDSFYLRKYLWSFFNYQTFFLFCFISTIFSLYKLIKAPSYKYFLCSYFGLFIFAQIFVSFFGAGFMGFGRHLYSARMAAVFLQVILLSDLVGFHIKRARNMFYNACRKIFSQLYPQ